MKQRMLPQSCVTSRVQEEEEVEVVERQKADWEEWSCISQMNCHDADHA